VRENQEPHSLSLRGFVYITDDPQSDENRDFAQRVEYAFEQSGMNDFIRQIEDESLLFSAAIDTTTSP